jgi:SpoVK/Ycf46/Vps4 family AAA+-type ATPase
VGDYQEVELDPFGRRKIHREKLIGFFARQTGLPRFVLWEQQARPWKELVEHFQRRIIGQTAASETGAEIVATLQQGLNDPTKPLATLLFVGPTGVGKTETAKALAEYLFGHKDRMIRLDMSEFRDPWSVSRLFGDRHQPEGELTRRVGQQPFCVVLLDEVEKAHPAVFDSFLQVLGEGRLTNAAGRTTDFCNAIVILTSNLGVRQAQQSLGFADTSGDREDLHYKKAAEGFFRPEFFNRIDRIVAFRSLGRDAMVPLVRVILLELLGRRGLRRSGVLVQVEPDLMELLIDQGFDPRYGARSMRRALEQRLMVPLARHLVTQAVDRTTLVQLYRFGGEIGMELWSLEDAQVTRATSPQVKGWGDLQARFAALLADVEELEADPAIVALQESRSALLASFNAGSLGEPAWGRLQGANLLLEQMLDLRRDLSEFQDEYMERYQFFEEISILHDEDLVRNHGRQGAPKAVGLERPSLVDRDVIFRAAVGRLRDLERASAALWFRGQVIQTEEERALVRFVAATDEPGALRWMTILASSYFYAREWWEAVLYLKRDGQWFEMHGQTHFADIEREGLGGFALGMRGFGLKRLLERELGFHLQLVHAGPDLLCNLVRVEDVIGPDPDEDPVARLTALDQQLQEFRAARREGRALPDPMPCLPVRRRFDRASATDPETGEVVTIQLDETHHKRVYKMDGLMDVVARRLLEELRASRKAPSPPAPVPTPEGDAPAQGAHDPQDETDHAPGPPLAAL